MNLDPTRWKQINEWTWESIEPIDFERYATRPTELINRAIANTRRRGPDGQSVAAQTLQDKASEECDVAIPDTQTR